MLFPLTGAYLAIWFARRYDPALDYARHVGDLSYGVYIYGWPSAQLVMFLSRLWEIPTVILRIGAVYGPDATGPLVRIQRMMRGKEVWVNPTEPREASVMWVDDAVRLAIKALTSGSRWSHEATKRASPLPVGPQL